MSQPSASQRRCPKCDRLFDPEQSRALPFCSDRCRLADLGRWLDEGYGLPYESADGEDEPQRMIERDEED